MSNTNKATLSPEDRKTFFRLFIPLLDFTNQKYDILICKISKKLQTYFGQIPKL